MSTPSEAAAGGDWGARPPGSRRSVYSNYEKTGEPESSTTVPVPTWDDAPTEVGTGNAGADLALARSFVYRVLAAAYADPAPETWAWLSSPETQAAWARAWGRVGPEGVVPVPFPEAEFGAYRDAYVEAFGHAARGPCPINEIEYGLPGVDPMFLPHRLADLAGFYRAFGMELAEEADERPDHVSVELEFMCILAAKEAWARERGPDPEGIRVCAGAQRKFLREHVGLWVPAFARRLEGRTENPVLRGVARCTFAFVQAECVRWGVRPGSAELALRPVNEALERLCANCGLATAVSGAGRLPG